MRRWLIAFAALLASFFGLNLFAEDNNLSWDAPTTLEDGSPLADLAGFNVYHSVDGGPFNLIASTQATETDYLHAGQTDGVHCYQVTAFRANGLESVPSMAACKTVDTLLPSSPTNLSVR